MTNFNWFYKEIYFKFYITFPKDFSTLITSHNTSLFYTHNESHNFLVFVNRQFSSDTHVEHLNQFASKRVIIHKPTTPILPLATNYIKPHQRTFCFH